MKIEEQITYLWWSVIISTDKETVIPMKPLHIVFHTAISIDQITIGHIYKN